MHNTELVITEELQKKFEAEADIVVNAMIQKLNMPVPKEIEYFRDGYISALGDIYLKNKGVPSIPYPVSLSTVDIVCIAYTAYGAQVMMGRKPGQPGWQFPGGFRDPKETSRFAAARELNEEANLVIDPVNLELIGELFVDDIRYRNLPHKITTSVFLHTMYGEEMSLASPGDDLGEIKWFSLKELCKDTSVIRDIHLPIFEMLKKHLSGWD